MLEERPGAKKKRRRRNHGWRWREREREDGCYRLQEALMTLSAAFWWKYMRFDQRNNINNLINIKTQNEEMFKRPKTHSTVKFSYY